MKKSVNTFGMKFLYGSIVAMVVLFAAFYRPAPEPTNVPEYPKVIYSSFVETGSQSVDYQLTDESNLVHLSASEFGGQGAVFTQTGRLDSETAVFVVTDGEKQMVIILNDKGEIKGSFTSDDAVTGIMGAELRDSYLKVWFTKPSGDYLWTKAGEDWSIEKLMLDK